MKLTKIFTCLLLSILTLSVCTTVNGQAAGNNHKVQKVKTNYGKMVTVGVFDTTTTFDATPVIIEVLTIANNTAGIIEVTAKGVAATGNRITGKLVYSYKKVSGTLTVSAADTTSTVVVDTALSGGGFAGSADASNNFKLTITGKAAVPILWTTRIDPF